MRQDTDGLTDRKLADRHDEAAEQRLERCLQNVALVVERVSTGAAAAFAIGTGLAAEQRHHRGSGTAAGGRRRNSTAAIVVVVTTSTYN